MSFFNAAQKPITDIGAFIKQNTTSGVKYSGVASENHRLYFPFVTPQNGGEPTIMAVQAAVHDIHTAPDKYESCICLHGITRQDKDGNVLNDGTCPFCDRVSSSYEIKNYREALALADIALQGKDLEDYKKKLSSQYNSELKVGKAKVKAYVLVAKFVLDASGNPVSTNGVPNYELKVMAMSLNRLAEFNTLFTQAGMRMAGGEISIKYPNTKDARLLVSQSTCMPAYDNIKITSNQALLAKIQAEAANFDWSVLETSFPEWRGMTTEAAAIKCATMFNAWDKYLAEKAVNPDAKYLEYDAKATAKPALAAPTPQVAPYPMPQPTAPAPTPQVAPAPIPQAAPTPQVAPQQAPGAFNGVDINAMFGNMKL